MTVESPSRPCNAMTSGSSSLATNPTVPASPRARLAFDRYDTAVITRTYRVFLPLVDPTATVVLPEFGCWHCPGTFNRGDDTDPGQPMTIAAAVETNDGRVLPFTVSGGQPTFTFLGAGGVIARPDQPRSIGAPISITSRRDELVSGFWLRTYLAVAPSRHDRCDTTADSPTITEPAITSQDRGKMATGSGIPECSSLGTVVPGRSVELCTSPTHQADIAVTASDIAVEVSLAVSIPLNLGCYHHGDAATTSTGPDLTRPGSGAVHGPAEPYFYGPLSVLTRASRVMATKPVVALIVASILDGGSEEQDSPYFGPVARGPNGAQPHDCLGRRAIPGMDVRHPRTGHTVSRQEADCSGLSDKRCK